MGNQHRKTNQQWKTNGDIKEDSRIGFNDGAEASLVMEIYKNILLLLQPSYMFGVCIV